MVVDGVESLWALIMLNYSISSVIALSRVLIGIAVIPHHRVH